MFPRATPKQVQMLRASFGLNESTQVILGVFRFSDEKRPLLFIEIARELAERYEHVRVILAGIGPLLDRMRNALVGSPSADRIHLVGKRDDVNVLMGAACLLLHTADREGMPNVVMEAVTSGVPVVATDVGAISSLVVDGETGFLHAAGDQFGLRDSCVRLLTDPALVERMRKAAKLRAARIFSPTSMAHRYLEASTFQLERAATESRPPSHLPSFCL